MSEFVMEGLDPPVGREGSGRLTPKVFRDPVCPLDGHNPSPMQMLLDPMCSPFPSPAPSPFSSPRSDDPNVSLDAPLLREKQFDVARKEAKVQTKTQRTTLKPPSATLFSSWCVLTNTLLGVGILGLPWAMSNLGLALGGAMLYSAGFMSALALHLLSALATQLVGGSDGPADITFYSVCIRVAPSARHIVDVAIAIKCFGVATSYLQVVAQVGTSLAGEFLDWDSQRLRSNHIRCIIVVVVVAVVIAPVVFHKTITKTAIQNLVAIFSWLYVASLVTLYATGVLRLHTGEEHTWQVAPPENMGFWQFASVLPVFIFSFTCHQNLFPIASELQGRSLQRLDIVLVGAIGCGLCIYSAAGFCGYLKFGEQLNANFLLNLPPSLLVTVGRCFVLVAVIFTYPLQLHPCRRSWMILIQSARGKLLTRREDRIMRRIFTVCILLGTSMLALQVEDLGLTLSVVGAVGSNTVVLIMPGFLYMRAQSTEALGPCYLWYLALGLFLLGCIIMPTCLIAIFWKVMSR